MRIIGGGDAGGDVRDVDAGDEVADGDDGGDVGRDNGDGGGGGVSDGDDGGDVGRDDGEGVGDDGDDDDVGDGDDGDGDGVAAVYVGGEDAGGIAGDSGGYTHICIVLYSSIVVMSRMYSPQGLKLVS